MKNYPPLQCLCGPTLGSGSASYPPIPTSPLLPILGCRTRPFRYLHGLRRSLGRPFRRQVCMAS
ncbi:hypothetical protein K443DRAFT_581957 [Laccaria amethystina LaAM-08-1]|uniref:Uncharacterized protein n=1 Tax=Laccaria amethystina LaAM-08-1 TaxID=1095629 RepID=A0A0C9WGU0_9AGAR|nr:hypothetical protein K443DRAFT_581957 [Laccaria amethystina LaAM-08-1]